MAVFILVAIGVGRQLGIYGAQAAIAFGRRVAGWAARGGPVGSALWARTGAPFLAARKKEREEIAKDLARTGAFAGLGKLAGAPVGRTLAALRLPSKRMQAVQRRQEDEEVKDLKVRSVPLGQLELKNVAHARYAAQEGLYEAATDKEMKDMLQTLADAGRTGTSEFGKLRTEYLKRLPHTGVADLAAMKVISQAEIADQQNKAVAKLTDLDYVKALQKERNQPIPVDLLVSYKITGSVVRAIREHGEELEWSKLMNQRTEKHFTPGAEAEYKRAPGGPKPSAVP